MSDRSNLEPPFRPGDVVNGHMLNADGTRWIPLAAEDGPSRGSAPPNGLAGTQWSTSETGEALPAAFALALNQEIRSALIRSYVFLGIAAAIGLVAAVTAAHAAAEGGVVWTGGGLVAAGLVYVAFRNNLSAVQASKALSTRFPDQARRHIYPFLLASVSAVVLIGAIGWTFWSSQASLEVGDCVFETAAGVERIDCAADLALWRVSTKVTAPSECPPTSSGEIDYLSSDDDYYCLSRN